MDTLKQLIDTGQNEAAWHRLFDLVGRTADYTDLLSLCRWRDRLARQSKPPGTRKAVKLALLGGVETELLEAPLALAIEAVGLDVRIHRSDYNTFAQEMLDSRSRTTRFGPDVAVVVVGPPNLPSWPQPGDAPEDVQVLVEEVCEYFLGLCGMLHEHTKCEVVLNNMHPLPTRPLGNLAAKLSWDANRFIKRVNLALGERAPAYVHFNDVDALVAQYGLRQWIDLRYWYHAKQPVSFQCLPTYVRNTASIVGALFGVTAKCLVLDLDNTLWGGVVGDDGIEGIRIGEGDAVSEAYKEFQHYLLKLKQRGILLCVCSKNEEAIALEAFESHPEMVLKREDFLVFNANWVPKPQNIIQIAKQLNIGLDSLVFIDDNPAEREQVRQRLPEVKVVELGDDPADYPRLIEEACLLEVTAISAEDRQRSVQYQQNIEREQLRGTLTDPKAFLATLSQKAVVHPFDQKHLERITQLINKTNQFNLTTMRMSRSQVDQMMRRDNVLTAYLRLSDRFGDNGLVSVFSAHREDAELVIDLWLMSCRVIQRGAEQLLCNHAVDQARVVGVSALRGTYIPTAKNGLVRDHYESLGFTQLDGSGDGTTHWRLALDEYTPFDVSIATVQDY